MSEHPAWRAALERYEGGYGEPFDPTDADAIGPFMQLLEEAVHDRLTRELVRVFRDATARLRDEIGEEVPSARP